MTISTNPAKSPSAWWSSKFTRFHEADHRTRQILSRHQMTIPLMTSNKAIVVAMPTIALPILLAD